MLPVIGYALYLVDVLLVLDIDAHVLHHPSSRILTTEVFGIGMSQGFGSLSPGTRRTGRSTSSRTTTAFPPGNGLRASSSTSTTRSGTRRRTLPEAMSAASLGITEEVLSLFLSRSEALSPSSSPGTAGPSGRDPPPLLPPRRRARQGGCLSSPPMRTGRRASSSRGRPPPGCPPPARPARCAGIRQAGHRPGRARAPRRRPAPPAEPKLLQRRHEPVQADRGADAGQALLRVQRGEVVVAPARADRADVGQVGEEGLEDDARVVVQAARDGRIQHEALRVAQLLQAPRRCCASLCTPSRLRRRRPPRAFERFRAEPARRG